MRIALCLDCSKRFEALRENNNKREEYLKAIRCTDVSCEGKVEIPIGHEDTLTFTATHLAEVQELLKRMSEQYGTLKCTYDSEAVEVARFKPQLDRLTSKR